jgi:hypothetical protein
MKKIKKFLKESIEKTFSKTKNIFSNNFDKNSNQKMVKLDSFVQEASLKQKLRRKKMQLGITIIIFLELLAFSKKYNKNPVGNYHDEIPKIEFVRLVQQDINLEESVLLENTDVVLVSSADAWSQSRTQKSSKTTISR